MSADEELRCEAAISLTEYEINVFNNLPGRDYETSPRASCALDEHEGPHAAFVQSISERLPVAVDWWLRWTNLSREIVVLPHCKGQTVGGMFNEVQPCLHFEGHPGRHSYEQDPERGQTG